MTAPQGKKCSGLFESGPAALRGGALDCVGHLRCHRGERAPLVIRRVDVGTQFAQVMSSSQGALGCVLL